MKNCLYSYYYYSYYTALPDSTNYQLNKLNEVHFVRVAV